MASFELPELPETRISPQMVMGAVSPLWAYFGAAAAGGVAYWWMTRWTQVSNLEALFGATAKVMTPAPVETLAEAVEMQPVPVGGEAAPISPIVAVAAEPVIDEPAPTLEATPEPTVESAPEPVIEAAPEPDVLAEPEAIVEAAPEPEAEVLPEPVAKPRVRKAAPDGPETQH